jgi:hypothetical protein
MSAAAIRAGQAFVELTIRDKLGQGLNAASARLKAFAASVSAVAALAIKHFANLGSELHDMSLRTGLATDNLSELKYAAEQTGATIQDVEKAIRFMQKQGLDATKFDEVLKAVSGIADASERAAMAMKIFGRGGTSLLSMAKELPQLRQEARELGVSVSPGRAALSDALGDEFGRLKTALSGLAMNFGDMMAPAVLAVTQMLVGAVVGLSKFTVALAAATKSLVGKAASWFEGLTGKGQTTPQGMAFKQLLLWLQGKPNLFDEQAKKKRRPPPDLSEFLMSRVGQSSRGQFGGFRAGALGIGSGASTKQQLEDVKRLLKNIDMHVQ